LSPLWGRKEDSVTQINTTETKTAKPSTKLLAKWSGELTVGIYERCAWSIRLYEDRAIVRMPYVKWIGQTGTLDFARNVYTGRILRKLLALAADTSEVDQYGDPLDKQLEARLIVSW
jgi:hypothetical protein